MTRPSSSDRRSISLWNRSRPTGHVRLGPRTAGGATRGLGCATRGRRAAIARGDAHCTCRDRNAIAARAHRRDRDARTPTTRVNTDVKTFASARARN